MANSPTQPEPAAFNLFDPDFTRCPQPVYARMHAECPVSRMSFTGSPIVSRYEDVLWALRHPEIFSSAMDLQMALGTERPMIPQQVDPPAQTRYRKLLDPHFSRPRMAALEPALRAQANALIDGFVAAGRCDFDPAFAIPLPCSAFLSLLGLPQSDLALFLRLKNAIIRPTVQGHDPEGAQRIRKQAGHEIYAYFDAVLDEREARPREDLVTELTRLEREGEKLTRHELLDVCFLLLLAGLDTVTATLGCNVAYLAANPEQRRRLAADPALIPNAVEELLRWETPVTGVPRLVKQTVTLSGVELKEGELVTLLVGAANVDAAEFPEPARVDFERERNRHLAFGGGPHRCLGSHLARLELRVALEEWHRRIPDYALEPGATPRYSAGIREVMHLPLVWRA